MADVRAAMIAEAVRVSGNRAGAEESLAAAPFTKTRLRTVRRNPGRFMSMPMSEMTGHVVLAQEGGFLLEDGRGRKRLFVLSGKSGLDPGQLQDLAKSGVKLAVRYSEPENAGSG